MGIKDTHFLKFEVKFDVRFPQKAEMTHISTVFIWDELLPREPCSITA